MSKDKKNALRRIFREKRKQISQKRREDVQEKLLNSFWPKLAGFGKVLSFASKGDEIDLWEINRKLAQEGRLLLPRMEEDHLIPYVVHALDQQLEVFSPWYLKQPDPHKCLKINLKEVSILIAPALAFDSLGYRLGYGRGFYDRLIEEVAPVPSWGIGFLEQFSSMPLPIEDHDKPVSQIILL